jgi:hypothetical protein
LGWYAFLFCVMAIASALCASVLSRIQADLDARCAKQPVTALRPDTSPPIDLDNQTPVPGVQTPAAPPARMNQPAGDVDLDRIARAVRPRTNR